MDDVLAVMIFCKIILAKVSVPCLGLIRLLINLLASGVGLRRWHPKLPAKALTIVWKHDLISAS